MESEEKLTTNSLTDHLTELRTRLVRSLWGIMLAMVICYSYSEKIFEFVRKPIERFLPTGGLVFTAPTDKFLAHIKLSFFSALILACPFWLYQLWKFISPGLYSQEKKYTIGFIFSGTALFLTGNAFAYFIVFPSAFEFLMNFGGPTDKPMITIDQYLSFFTLTTLMFGLAFELPLIIVILGMFGIVTKKFLQEKRRFAILILAVIAAVLTPPDLLSMLFMLVPLLILFEISILLVGFFEKKAQTVS